MIRRLEDFSAVDALFAGWEETLILSALSGVMGSVWAEEKNPESAMCMLGDFVFYAGKPDEALVCFSPDPTPRFAILTPQNEGWEEVIRKVYGAKCVRQLRYAFSKTETRFDQAHLQALSSSLPAGYRMQTIDRQLYEECKRHWWSSDFVSQFENAEDYARRGLGVAAFFDGHLAGGASSYSVFPGGIEIEIDVQEEHRRKGLATALAAQLILLALSKGLYPSWDAANHISVQLARKLGYGNPREYPVYFTESFGCP